MDDRSYKSAYVENVMRIAEEIVHTLPVHFGNLLRMQDCTNYVELTATKERPQCKVVNLPMLHPVGCVEAAWHR